MRFFCILFLFGVTIPCSSGSNPNNNRNGLTWRNQNRHSRNSQTVGNPCALACSIRGGGRRKKVQLEKVTLPKGMVSVGKILEYHKGLWLPVSLVFMYLYQNFSARMSLMTGMFGSYGINWVLKSFTFHDKNLYNDPEMHQSLLGAILTFGFLSLYFIFPWAAAKNPNPIGPLQVILASFLFSVGSFFHYGADAQKYYTLKYKGSGLITEGFYSKLRRPNYYGEDMIFAAFVIVAGVHAKFTILLPILYYVMGIVVLGAKNANSLTRYSNYEEWKKSTWF